MDEHIKEQLSNHVVDLVKTINSSKSAFANMEEVLCRNEPLSQEQAMASQEGSLNELSTRTQHLRNENDEMRRIIEGLSNRMRHLQQQLEELRASQERPLQELNIR